MDQLTSDIAVEQDTTAEPRQQPLPGPLRIIGRLLAGILILLFVAWLVLYVTKGRFLKHPFEKFASSELQRPVTVAGDFNLYFAPFNVAFLAEKISIANPPWADDRQFFTAQRVALQLRTWPLLFGKRQIAWLDLNSARVAAEWDKHHLHNSWTFGDPDKHGAPMQLPDIERGTITGTKVVYRDPLMQLMARIGIDTVHTQDTHFDNEIRFSGSGMFRNNPLTFSGGVLNPNQAVAGGRTRLALHADAARTIIDLTGTLPAATRFDGAKLRFAARGEDMADLFHIIGVTSVRTRRYHLTSDLTYTGTQWEFTRLAGEFGDSDLAGRLTAAMPKERLKLTANLTTRSLDILDAGPFIGYDPKRLDAMGTSGAVRTVNGHPRIIPDAEIPVSSLGAFDADVHYHVGEIRGKDFPVSNIDVTLILDHSQLRLHPARASLAGGTLTADLLLNGRHSPALTEYDVRLSPTPMGRLLARFGVADSGTTGTLSGRIHMRGYGASLERSLATSSGRMVAVIPTGTLWERNVKLSELNLGTFVQKMFQKKLKAPVEMNCGVVAFTVRGGIAAADPILIDTKKSVITGNGGFSFRDEALDMSVRAKSKTFSLFSLQSPVGINGYLAAPGIQPISKQLVTRAGVAVAAGVLLSPFATLAAFVDLGNAKAAACGPVLAGDTAAEQRTTKGKPRQDVGKPAPDKLRQGNER